MKAIVCVDERNGMCFNHRRQSSDCAVVADILRRTAGAPVWMNAYSAPLFDGAASVHVSEDFLHEAPDDAWCFVEDQSLQAVADRLDAVIIYRWNRHYPHDVRLDLHMEEWQCVLSEDFVGHSHEKITREEYQR